jgi:hypothetical protein
MLPNPRLLWLTAPPVVDCPAISLAAAATFGATGSSLSLWIKQPSPLPSSQEMRASSRLQIVYRLVGHNCFLGDVSMAIFQPLVPVIFHQVFF